jgi:hypothetical protein
MIGAFSLPERVMVSGSRQTDPAVSTTLSPGWSGKDETRDRDRQGCAGDVPVKLSSPLVELT